MSTSRASFDAALAIEEARVESLRASLSNARRRLALSEEALAERQATLSLATEAEAAARSRTHRGPADPLRHLGAAELLARLTRRRAHASGRVTEAEARRSTDCAAVETARRSLAEALGRKRTLERMRDEAVERAAREASVREDLDE